MIDTYESVTAKLCSFARAYHSNWVKSKIFDDYLAYDLMGGDEYEEIGQLIERGFKFGEYRQSCNFDSKKVYSLIDTYISPIPLSRIAYAENELAEFAGRHEICQYVICGAGMDTFSFRNDNDNIRIFELDHPDTQKYKLKKIKELEWNIPENVSFVPIDFAKDDMKKVLIKAGFNPEIPAFFAILGVTYYLTLSVFEDTLKNISELSPAGSEIVFDYPDETTFSKRGAKRVQRLTQITESLGEPMRHGFSIGELENALNRHEFSIKEHFSPKDIQAKFFDGREDGQRAFENIHFISTVKEKKQMNTHIFTSESVTKGHPDKVSDIISDSILDAYISKDKNARVAAETAVKNNTIVLLGEISSDAEVDIESVVRNAVKSIGYNKAELGFNADTAAIINLLDKQSPDIAQGVDRALEARNKNDKEQLGAGDQGMVFGYASDDTEELMPLAAYLSRALSKRLTEVRENNVIPYLRPDGKTQVSIKYANDKPTLIDTIVISTQHNENVEQKQIHDDIKKYVIQPVIPENLLSNETKFLINPTGRFVIGGPVGDSGLTGRKIIVDTYGGAAHHGGGAFSGKDPTKVDRSAAYAARYIAKNIVAAGLAKKAEIQIAYAIGVAQPVSLSINTFGTETVSVDKIEEAVRSLVDLSPGGIIERFNLKRGIYADTAANGHFGRKELPWEQTDIADTLSLLKEKKMKRIASFAVNHDRLKKGMYISRTDGDVITYDIRMKKPNGGDYLSNGAIHTFEHLFATYARNSPYAENVIYVGPMGCRTGFYLLLRESISYENAIRLVKQSFEFIKDFNGIIPGSRREECGNYKEHDLEGARNIAEDMLAVLSDWSEDKLYYEN